MRPVSLTSPSGENRRKAHRVSFRRAPPYSSKAGWSMISGRKKKPETSVHVCAFMLNGCSSWTGAMARRRGMTVMPERAVTAIRRPRLSREAGMASPPRPSRAVIPVSVRSSRAPDRMEDRCSSRPGSSIRVMLHPSLPPAELLRRCRRKNRRMNRWKASTTIFHSD